MLKILSIVWGVTDVPRAAKFWSEALDYVIRPDMLADWAVLTPRMGHGIQLSLKPAASPRARRHHMDLYTNDRDREVARLLQLGARRVENWRYPDPCDYVVLEDPDGNRFCVVHKEDT